VNQARAFTGGSASIHCRTLLGGAQSNSRSTAHGAPLSFRAVVSPWPNRAFRALWSRRRPLYSMLMAAARSRPGTRSRTLTYCNAGTLHRRRPDQLQVPVPLATDLVRCSLSRSLMRLAVFKMMHRPSGRQGCGQLLTALAGLTDRERSRQNFSSALWAPLTLRLSPGAASFQHQPTREETT
jgi:hypothetical protein